MRIARNLRYCRFHPDAEWKDVRFLRHVGFSGKEDRKRTAFLSFGATGQEKPETISDQKLLVGEEVHEKKIRRIPAGGNLCCPGWKRMPDLRCTTGRNDGVYPVPGRAPRPGQTAFGLCTDGRRPGCSAAGTVYSGQRGRNVSEICICRGGSDRQTGQKRENGPGVICLAGPCPAETEASAEKKS